jgi:hypothetical protein
VRTIAACVLLGSAAFVSAPPASAACENIAKAPSAYVAGYGTAGPYVEGCNFDCGGAVVATPAQNVPGVVSVGTAYVNDCL